MAAQFWEGLLSFSFSVEREPHIGAECGAGPPGPGPRKPLQVHQDFPCASLKTNAVTSLDRRKLSKPQELYRPNPKQGGREVR